MQTIKLSFLRSSLIKSEATCPCYQSAQEDEYCSVPVLGWAWSSAKSRHCNGEKTQSH